MLPWEQRFVDQAKEMTEAGKTESGDEVDGIISWQPHRSCPVGCEPGVYLGIEIDIGDIFMRGVADFCPSCTTVFLLKHTPPIYLYMDYLRLLRQKVIEGITDPNLTDGEPCPTCGKITKVYARDLTAMDPGLNTWRVCADPNCSWPGEHKVAGK